MGAVIELQSLIQVTGTSGGTSTITVVTLGDILGAAVAADLSAVFTDLGNYRDGVITAHVANASLPDSGHTLAIALNTTDSIESVVRYGGDVPPDGPSWIVKKFSVGGFSGADPPWQTSNQWYKHATTFRDAEDADSTHPFDRFVSWSVEVENVSGSAGDFSVTFSMSLTLKGAG